MPYKKDLSEQEIRSQYIYPALIRAGWNPQSQIRESVSLTDGRIYVKGRLTTRGSKKQADYVLYYPVAVIEAKRNTYSVQAGIQQALSYAALLDIPSVYSSNGDGFFEHDRTCSEGCIERELSLDTFPSPETLWQRYKKYKGINSEAEERIAGQDYFFDGSRSPRYYQQTAINRVVEAVAKGQQRILLTMATGTGKTYTAFQIIHRLRKTGCKKRILFLADRNNLIDQTARGDFRHFKDKMTVVRKKKIDKSFEVYLALYQGLTDYDEDRDAYREFSPNFFDLIVIDECHRGSAAEDSAWREILNYFSSATHIGLTATPKETATVSSSEYFGEPIYTYSLKQGIRDGFLAPYKVLRIGLNVDLEGWRPELGKTDKQGLLVEDRMYNSRDFDRNLVIDERTEAVAKRVNEFLRKNGRFDKTIVFCVDINHAERMRTALATLNSDLMAKNSKYVMQITGDNAEGKKELGNFINPDESHPVIATTSKLMTTGVNAQTCKLIVLDSNINSMTEFKQIIGRGTRINEEYGKRFFTIMDFREVTKLFADPEFDDDPVRVREIQPDDALESPEEEDSSQMLDENGKELVFESLPYGQEALDGSLRTAEPAGKVFVNGVDVHILNERRQYIDSSGRLITGSLKEYTREKLRAQYRSLDDFLQHWSAASKKQVLLQELEQQDIMVEELQEAVSKEMDIFDLLCHIAYDQPPLTKAERIRQVKKRDYFSRYGEQARKVLEALLEKYAQEGIACLEDKKILQVKPLNQFGSPMEIVNFFGGEKAYLRAVADLEQELYRAA